MRPARALFAFVVLVSAPAAAASVDPAILDAVRTIKPADYPSANSVLLVEDQAVVYQADGRFENTFHTVRLVLTPHGAQGAAVASLDYARDAEKIEVLGAQVIKADGTVVPVAPASIQDTEQSGDENIYDPNGRSVKITFEGLAAGDATDLRYRLTLMTPRRPGFFADEFAFQSGEPIREASYTVDGPASLPLTAALYHPERGATIDSRKTRDGDRIHYRWSVAGAPQLVPEILMDAMNEIPMLVVSTDPSWEHFSRWWAGLTAPRMEASDDIRRKVAELTRDAKTEAAKIKALYDFVAADVRYRGLGVGPRTGYTPRRAADTFTSRWGVCRDVAILLATMLRTAGFQAYPVLTNVGEPVLPRVAYDGFNHAIVAMPKKGGGWTYLDPTAKNSIDLLPGHEREQSALVCTPRGEPLGRIPAGDPAANRGHAVARSVLAPDGTLTSTITVKTRGMFDMVLRSVAASVPPEKQREIVERLIHASLPRAEIVSFKMSSALILWSPMQLEIGLRVPDAAVQTGDYRLLSTVVTSGALGLVENVLPLAFGGLPARKYTLDAQLTFQYDQDETVTLPPGTRVLALPNEAHAANAVSALTASCAHGDRGTVTCHRSFQLRSRFIDPGQYSELRSVLASLGQMARQPVILGSRRP